MVGAKKSLKFSETPILGVKSGKEITNNAKVISNSSFVIINGSKIAVRFPQLFLPNRKIVYFLKLSSKVILLILSP